MKALVIVIVGLMVATVSVVQPAIAAPKDGPAKLTFLAASCPASSSMYQRKTAGQDPSSNDNGSPAAPGDISAYGCTPMSGLNLFFLGDSTAGSAFIDEGLQKSVALSSSESSFSGATLIPAGSSVYLPGGKAQTRRVSVREYPTTLITTAPLPFLDLQCSGDGANNDNADGAGWYDESFRAGETVYCIAYVWDEVKPTPSPTATATATRPPPGRTPSPSVTVPASATSTATPSPTTAREATRTSTPTASPTTTGKPVRFKLSTRVWETDGDGEDDDDGKWKKATPEGQWRYQLSDANGVPLQEFLDSEDLDLVPGDYLVTFVGPVNGDAVAAVFDFVLSRNGNSECKAPDGGRTSLKLSTENFDRNGTVHACAFLKPKAPSKFPRLQKTFVEEGDGVIIWKLAPEWPADLLVWDSAAVSCAGHNGALCGDITSGGAGAFSAAQPGQYLLIKQPFEKRDEKCKVVNKAEYGPKSGRTRTVTATYRCSGAPTMGWGLFGIGAFAAVGVAWIVQRKVLWER